MANNYFGRICLDSIPDGLSYVGKDGRRYVNIEVRERRDVSRYGYTHFVRAYKICESMEDARERPFIGDLRPSRFNGEGKAVSN